jgi:hypothetical protein
VPVSSTPKRRSANLLLKNRQTLARPQPESDTAAKAPGLRDWIGVLAMGTGLFMAIMDVQIVTGSLTQIQSSSGLNVRWRCSMKQAASKLGFRSAPLADLPTI